MFCIFKYDKKVLSKAQSTKLQKEARERYQNLSEKEKEKSVSGIANVIKVNAF